MATTRQNKKAQPKIEYDYSDITTGLRVQAEVDGTYYSAFVVQVSTSKARTKAPVKVNFKGYDSSSDIWVGGDRLRSKALKRIVVAPEVEDRPPLEFKFGYWKIRGLGAVFRMIFEYKGATYTDVQYESSDKWFKEDKPIILEKNPLANLPYLDCGNDCICQTNAILNYLGNRLRLNGAGNRARQLNDELLCEIYDVRNAMIDTSYPFRNVCRSEAEFKEKATKVLEGAPFAKFEAILVKNGTEYFCGKAPCTSDFHIWEMLDQHRLLAAQENKGDIFASIPKCKEFYDRFRELPSLQKYFSSEAYKLPVNNPEANAYFK